MNRLILLFITLATFLGGIPPSQAKGNAPMEYQQGKLLDVHVEKEKTTSYVTQKQSNGTTVTTPQTNEQKHYFITVQAGDLVYVGEYTPLFFGKPGDWIIGDPIDVRFEGDSKMILKKPNGKELKTKIRKRIRVSDYHPN